MPEADTEGARYQADQPQTAPGFFLKGSHQLDWGMKNRLARVFNPQSGRTVMLGLVNKTAFAMRQPRRWEIVVFQLFGLDFIKRLLGLPGETVEIRDGDLYIDGRLCRKTLDEFKTMRIPVFDNNHQPEPMTWAAR